MPTQNSPADNRQSAPAPRAAYWDVDGTLAGTFVIMPLLYFKRRMLSGPAHAAWLLNLAVRGPWWNLLDRIDRSASNRALYASYRGMDCARVKSLAAGYFDERVKPRIFPQALREIEGQRASGMRIVLVTGGLDLAMRPLAEHLGVELFAPTLAEQDGRYTGALTGEPLVGEQKAIVVREHSRKHGIDLSQSFAYGDALGDLAMLECVGHPVAVNASLRLAKIAAARQWRSERWRR